MVSKASEDLPDPLRPVITVRVFLGISTSIFLRLCWRAPRTEILVIAIRPESTVMSVRNVDGSTDLLESRSAYFYVGILSVNSDQRQRGVDWNQSRAARLGRVLALSSGRRRFEYD